MIVPLPLRLPEPPHPQRGETVPTSDCSKKESAPPPPKSYTATLRHYGVRVRRSKGGKRECPCSSTLQDLCPSHIPLPKPQRPSHAADVHQVKEEEEMVRPSPLPKRTWTQCQPCVPIPIPKRTRQPPPIPGPLPIFHSPSDTSPQSHRNKSVRTSACGKK